MSNNWDSSRVEDKIGIRFKYNQTLRLALIHPSYAKQIEEPEINNRRLEFLGEAILNLVVVDYLYYNFSHFPIGKLKALRNKIIEPERLTKLWYDLQLGDSYPFLALQEERHRLRVKQQNPFEKAFKALLGAIYTDRGFSQARNWLHKNLIVPLLKRYLKEDQEHSSSPKQIQFLGDALLDTVVVDYLDRQVLYVNPSKIKPLVKKLISKESQAEYLNQLTEAAWSEISPEAAEPPKSLKTSFKVLLANVYLQFNADNNKDSFRKTGDYFAKYFIDRDEILQEAIALLLEAGKSQKWIIHNLMGYPSNKYNEGRDRYYELVGKPE
jgi:ribonuclease III